MSASTLHSFCEKCQGRNSCAVLPLRCCLELDLYEFYNRWEGVSPTAHHDFLPKYYGNLPLSQLLGFRHSVLFLL
jgi:hypothetical protein